MDLFLMRRFQQQVADQCLMTLHGVTVLNDGLKNVNHDLIWIGAQTLLTGAANISKALWGSGAKLADERKPLRESLGVTDSSPLREVSMRNNFEHYDERLDRWWSTSVHHNYVDRILGPPSTVAGVEDIDRFRFYDQTTHDIVFWGERFSVQNIATAADELLPVAAREAAKPYHPS